MVIKYKITVLLLIVCALASCTDWDDFKKYQAGGEIVYPGRGDTMLIASGRNRTQLLWVLSADPRVTAYKLYWNNKADSMEATVPADLIGDTVKIMINPLPEGSYNFEMYSLDAKGNRSVPLRFNGRTFGANYENGLLNRTISEASYDSTLKMLKVNWNTPDTVNINTELKYISIDSKTKSLLVGPEVQESKIPDWKPGTLLNYRSSFKPDKKAIDVFTVTRYDTMSVKKPE
ncbi:hypothetical protein J2Y45_003982 [Dyadobacter sp. BE34]|uniref:DUF4998 domain-containing protein n=1 Tax=Dyadobacter fermentans TaxID=94254 RepID=A0ABU1R097_9BACT|nr:MULTISPECIES: DUF4998 domain-containing protein [Dyadobacter]MDR6806790.1 hypothetical protein [Dyadobacter fermentans]MDR7044532.1 hypothetical protein [Dyadobacter sp. BE242]MDR7198842.1 hypothetical protein [Dyadobacter sp. BE34]MDR7216804.1 hypothetical protein [Dyadobacter sp. BE31]MDR7263670.1 hypothetical protein [Dyadobacter sp. BE32]